MTTQRYNAGIQRAKGLLEIAAGLYDSSLSYQTKRAAEGMLQTDTDLGRVLRLSLDTKKSETRPEVSISFTTGSFREIIAVAEGKYSLAWVNPSVLLTLAYRGTGPFPKRLPLRTVAVFPSYDIMGFAVHASTGNHILVTDRQRTYSAAPVHRRDTQKSANRKCDDVHGLGGFGRGGFFARRVAPVGR